MNDVLQISDPHFGTERPEVLEALVRLEARLVPDVVVLSGDITQRAAVAQFAAARRFVDRLACRSVIALPGNHDVPLFNLPLRLFRPYARYRAAFGRDLEPVFESPSLLVIAVNSVVPAWHKDGTVSEAQIQRVAARLERASRRQVRIVVTHHPLGARRAEDEHDLLRGAARARREWARAGVDVLMGGHIHSAYVLPLRDVDAGIERDGWIFQAGTAVSRRVRDGRPNSVNRLRLVADPKEPSCRCRLERWDFDAARGEFERVFDEGLRLARPDAATARRQWVAGQRLKAAR